MWFGNVGCWDKASRSPMRTIQMGIFKYMYAFKDCPSSGTTSWCHATMKYTASVGWAFDSHSGTVSRLTCIQYVGPPPYACIMFTRKKMNNNKSPLLLLLCCHSHLQFYMEAFTITQSRYTSCLLRIQEVWKKKCSGGLSRITYPDWEKNCWIILIYSNNSLTRHCSSAQRCQV